MLVVREGLYSLTDYLFVSQQAGNPLHTLYSLTFAPAEIWAIEVRLNCISRHSANRHQRSVHYQSSAPVHHLPSPIGARHAGKGSSLQSTSRYGWVTSPCMTSDWMDGCWRPERLQTHNPLFFFFFLFTTNLCWLRLVGVLCNCGPV